MVKRWTVGQSHFPVVRRVPRVRPRAFPKARKTMKKVFNRNTHKGVNVKTMLRSENVMKDGEDFSVERYALGVYNELCMALEGLVEK